MRVWGIAGWKNSGKTHLVARLLADLSARGVAVSTLKHAHHDAQVDHPGTDSFRHRLAGAREVLLVSPRRWALMAELRGAPEPPLEAMLARLSPVDLVLVEGYKRAAIPRLEVWRAATGRPLMAPQDPGIRAIAADSPPPGAGDVPVFDLDDTGAIAGFILRETGL